MPYYLKFWDQQHCEQNQLSKSGRFNLAPVIDLLQLLKNIVGWQMMREKVLELVFNFFFPFDNICYRIQIGADDQDLYLVLQNRQIVVFRLSFV